MGGYAYAGDNPASGSDPTGLMRDGGGDCAAIQACNQGPVPLPQGSESSSTDNSSGNTPATSQKSGGGGCHGWAGCAGHYLEKAAPYVGVAVVAVSAYTVAGACTVESGGIAGVACIDAATAGTVAVCGAFLGDCGQGPDGDPTSEEAGEDAGAAKQAERDGAEAKAPTAGTKA
ncbi:MULTISPECIES: hypothetical protein [unclassified Streptomyces]|uniref:hypothetical protein n=1 Tax=unclassified Streptomyces TaxID=2593676 RepID=UPI002E2C7408|nr:hypothetical protein [Streptomyces sp. NBC_00223]